jgi:diacylglycerol kinase (ATP)
VTVELARLGCPGGAINGAVEYGASEAVVDLTVKQTYSMTAKIAKDRAAAAVLVAAIAALVGCMLILLQTVIVVVAFRP